MIQIITIKMKEGDMSIRAYTKGQLAIHHSPETDGKHFTLTHIPTGISISKGWHKAIYLRPLLKTCLQFDWERTHLELISDEQMIASMHASVKNTRNGKWERI